MDRKSKGGKMLITKQEMVLIKLSSEARNIEVYGNLYDCLEDYERLYEKDIENNIVFDKRAKAVLVSAENKKRMINNIIREWYSIKNFDVSEEQVHCQLCGRENKYIFYIHNKCTEEDLNVGSECVTKFPDIAGIKTEKQKMSQWQKEQARYKRKIEFESKEGENIGFLTDADNRFKNFPVVLPFNLHNEIKDVLYQMNLAKSSYVKSGGDLEEIFQKYELLKNRLDELFILAEKHFETVKNDLLVCDKNISEWLLIESVSTWEKVSKNRGLFDVETLQKVYDDKYIDEKIEEFRKHIKDSSIKMLQVNKKTIRFSVRNRRYLGTVTFLIPIKEFMKSIGCFCLTDKRYMFGKENLQNISIEVTENNFNIVYNSVSNVFRKRGYDFIIEEKTNQAYLKKLAVNEKRNKWSNRIHQENPLYKKSSVAAFLSILSPYLLKSEGELENNVTEVIAKIGSGECWITQKEKYEKEEAIKLARGMQKQREFLPY